MSSREIIVSEQYEDIIHNLPVVPYVCKAGGDFGATFIGESITRLAGYRPDELISDSRFWLEHIHPDDRDRVLAGFEALYGGGCHTHQYRWRIADGSYRWLEDFVQLVTDDSGQPKYLVGALHDIQARKEQELHILNLKDRAQAASDAKTAFMSRMSHNLRTPLNAIIGFSHILERRIEAGAKPDLRGMVQTIERAGQHLLRLVDDLLDIVNIENGELQVESRHCGLRDCVAAAVTACDKLFDGHRVQLQNKCDNYSVFADPERLQQVLTNLLSNAVKYSEPGDVVEISAAAERIADKERVEVRVVDNGVGIPEREQALLFEPFMRTAYARENEIEGSGVGLSLTKFLVEEMGGSIGFRSEAGIGSEFYFSLPRAPGAVRAGAACAHMARQRPVTILYIEDDLPSQDVLKLYLDENPRVALTVCDTAECAIEIARRQRFDLIIIDINLSGMDGLQAKDRLHRLDTAKDAVFAVLSADATAAKIKAAMAAGFSQYLTKPLDYAELNKVIDRLPAYAGQDRRAEFPGRRR